MGKELWTEDNEGEPLKLYAAFNEQDEARFIADTAQSYISEGNSRSTLRSFTVPMLSLVPWKRPFYAPRFPIGYTAASDFMSGPKSRMPLLFAPDVESSGRCGL